jgi:hypothetical protein
MRAASEANADDRRPAHVPPRQLNEVLQQRSATPPMQRAPSDRGAMTAPGPGNSSNAAPKAAPWQSRDGGRRR